MNDVAPAPEFSFIVDLDKLLSGEKRFTLFAGKVECAKIAKRLDVPAVESLEGAVALSATRTEIIARGRVAAALTRQCVASLERMDEHIGEAFEVVFSRTPPENPAGFSEEALAKLPETHLGGSFDIGELLVQQLSLAMDPFPRKKDAQSLAETYGAGAESSPFDVLKSPGQDS